MANNRGRKRPSKRELYVRRTVSTLVLLLVLVLLVCLGWWVVRYIGGLFGEQQSGIQSYTESAQSSLAIPTCTADDLSLSLEAASSTMAAGDSQEFTVTVENLTDVPCSISTSQILVQLTTGADDESVWVGSECSDSWTKTLLLSADQPWSGTLTWDGYVYDQCEVATNDDGDALTAGAGAYVGHIYFEGDEVGGGTPIVVE